MILRVDTIDFVLRAKSSATSIGLIPSKMDCQRDLNHVAQRWVL